MEKQSVITYWYTTGHGVTVSWCLLTFKCLNFQTKTLLLKCRFLLRGYMQVVVFHFCFVLNLSFIFYLSRRKQRCNYNDLKLHHGFLMFILQSILLHQLETDGHYSEWKCSVENIYSLRVWELWLYFPFSFSFSPPLPFPLLKCPLVKSELSWILSSTEKTFNLICFSLTNIKKKRWWDLLKNIGKYLI